MTNTPVPQIPSPPPGWDSFEMLDPADLPDVRRFVDAGGELSRDEALGLCDLAAARNTARLGLSEDEWRVLLDAIDKARVMLRQGIARSRAFADHDGVAAAERHIEVLDVIDDKLRAPREPK